MSNELELKEKGLIPPTPVATACNKGQIIIDPKDGDLYISSMVKPSPDAKYRWISLSTGDLWSDSHFGPEGSRFVVEGAVVTITVG